MVVSVVVLFVHVIFVVIVLFVFVVVIFVIVDVAFVVVVVLIRILFLILKVNNITVLAPVRTSPPGVVVGNRQAELQTDIAANGLS